MNPRPRKQDLDVKEMTAAQLRGEIMRLRRGIRKHRDAKDNARCWHNDLELYGLLPEEVEPGKMRGLEDELLLNCRRYIRRQQCEKNSCPRAQ